MKYLKEKIRIIFIPYLVITILLVISYTFLSWLLFIQLELFPVKEKILEIIIPVILPLLPILTILRRRTKIIAPTNKKGQGQPRTALVYVAWISMIAPIVIAQAYLSTASGKLTVLHDINQINVKPVTRYYMLQHYFIDKKNPITHSSSSVSGKHNEDLNFYLHVVVPIYVDSNIADSDNVRAWYGIKFRKTISNNLSEVEKDKIWDEFISKSNKDYDSTNLSQFYYLKNEGLNDNREKFVEALQTERPAIKENYVILIPQNEPFDKRNGNKMPWIFGSFGIGALIFLFGLLLVRIEDTELDKYQGNLQHNDVDDDTREFLMYFVPTRAHFVNSIIIDLNILVYLIMVFYGMGFVDFSADDLIKVGANYGPLTNAGQWWRLLTNTFLHGGLMHLLTNMFALLFVGIFLEPLIGRFKYLSAYIITGILASATSLWWHEATVSVGASGAIFGIYGVFLVLLLLKVFPKDLGKPFLITTLIFIGYNLVMGLAGGIDNAAHIGGLISGIIVGFILYPSLKNASNEETDGAFDDE